MALATVSATSDRPGCAHSWTDLPCSCVRTPRASPIRKLPAGTLTHRGRIRCARPGVPVTERATERGRLRVNATCVIRLDELEWRTTGLRRSGRPARQHVGHARRGAVPDHDVDRRWRRGSGNACSNGSDRWRAPPRPTPGRRPATARSPSSVSARAWRTRCTSTRPAARRSPRSRRSSPASTPSAASRHGSRTAAARPPTTEGRSERQRARAEESAKLHRMHVLSQHPVVRARDRPVHPRLRLGRAHLRAPAGVDAARDPGRVHRAPVGVQPDRTCRAHATTDATR